MTDRSGEERPAPIVHPQVQRFLDSLSAEDPEPTDLPSRRERMRQRAVDTGGTPEEVASIEERLIDGVPARIYQATSASTNVLVWLHGGGWFLGGLDTADAVARGLANRGDCTVVSVDYRLAPENPYPAALDDVWTIVQWAAGCYDRVAIGGESAGGNLAAAASLRARDEGLPLALQILVYPVLDWRTESPSYEEFRNAYAHFAGIEGYGAGSHDGMRYIWEIYVPNPSHRHEPGASPLRAASLGGVAATYVVAAEHDVLRGEIEEYVIRLREAGVEVELAAFEGQIHGFFPMLAVLDDARTAVDQVGAALRRAFAA